MSSPTSRSGSEPSWLVPPVALGYWNGLFPVGRLSSRLPSSSFTNLFFLAACGEARMLAIFCLWIKCSTFEGSLLRSRLCATTAPPASLFMAERLPISFQWRCRLFCTLSALDPVLMWARMVHSIPPLPGSACQLHSSWRLPLTANLYLRIFSSSSASNRRIKSSWAEVWVHLSSGGARYSDA